MPRSEPSLGERTKSYPLGYGYCQCGCGQSTRPSRNGIYPIYLEGHRTTPKPLNIPNARSAAPQEHLGLTSQKLSPRKQNRQDRSGDAPLLSALPEPKRYVSSDQPLLDHYFELTATHERLRRKVQLMRANLEQVTRLVDNFWVGEDGAKAIVIEKLRMVLADSSES